MVANIQDIFAEHLAGEKFRVQETQITTDLTSGWFQIIGSPIRFVPEVFSGLWAAPGKHPRPGKYRVLAIVDCADGFPRAVIRDGAHLYATPFV